MALYFCSHPSGKSEGPSRASQAVLKSLNVFRVCRSPFRRGQVRQALGRMFGFTLDAFSKIETVASLGLEMRMLKDYQMFASDYFRWGHTAQE